MAEVNLLDLYERGSAWTIEKVPTAVTMIDRPTPCDEGDVRALLNHMLDTQRCFLSYARGEEGATPASPPPELLSD